MDQVQVQIAELPSQKPECKFCGIEECKKCYMYIKKERIKNGLFIGGSAVPMIGLSFVAGSASLAFIGLGLTCGTLINLIYNLI